MQINIQILFGILECSVYFGAWKHHILFTVARLSTYPNQGYYSFFYLSLVYVFI